MRLSSERMLEIVAYDPAWPDTVSTERDRIAKTFGSLALRIDHHGSTSVPGLAAKPIIDIQISVSQLPPLETFASRLRAIGYVHVPHPDDAFCPFFHRPATWPHTHHVHVVQAGGAGERRTLAFRDYLRMHADVAQAYEALNRRLVTQHDALSFDSRQAYADAKTDFISRVTDQALAAGLPADL